MENKKLAQIRSEYLRGALDENSVNTNPILQFEEWLNEALRAETPHPTAMILATAGSDGQPTARIVLLKEITQEGFVFFTNYRSHKGKQIDENPKVGLTFFWDDLERQVRIEGNATKVPKTVSAEYFHSRPYESQLSASISPQSEIIAKRQQLESDKDTLRKKYLGQKLPHPEHWGGYLVKPLRIEFWQGRDSRLHDRIVYDRNAENWRIRRMAP